MRDLLGLLKVVVLNALDLLVNEHVLVDSFAGDVVVAFGLTSLFEHLHFGAYLRIVFIGGHFNSCHSILLVETSDFVQLGHRSLADVAVASDGDRSQGSAASRFGSTRFGNHLD